MNNCVVTEEHCCYSQVEAEDTRRQHLQEINDIKEEAAQQVLAAEARGRRAGAIDKEVAEAQIKAQQAALQVRN